MPDPSPPPVDAEPAHGEVCPETFRDTGQQCEKPDDGHRRHAYELWENGVRVEWAQWDTAR